MSPGLRVASFAALALLLPACGAQPQILGPTALDEGIVIFIHSGYRGSSQAVAMDVPNLSRVEGPCASGDEESTTLSWDDCVSSIRVMPGWGATLYKDRDYKGTTIELLADAENLTAIRGSCDGTFNDCVSSLKVYRR
jgi:hypothetical protein